ncbi:MAG: lipid-binding SYLF domain-containing protein [Sneathiella sp.]|uniref:lipid-binding SYLF domain-containing protein n=1 Tax=Sneathiella sp. TaxID=1964365 RepID=UPI003001843E
MRETINLVRRSILSFMAAGLLFAGTSSLATAGENQDLLVQKAKLTIEGLSKNPDLGEFRKLLAVAKGVVVFPQILEAGFFIGGAGGSGVLLGQDEEGNWTSPAFYAMGQGSIGLQFGAQAKELVLVVMTEKGVKAIINNNVKLGADLSAAVGPVGTAVGAATTTNLNSDVFSFANAKGLFIGASVAGSVLTTKKEWNELYYGKAVTPTAIVIDRSVNNAQSDGLRAALKAAEAP